MGIKVFLLGTGAALALSACGMLYRAHTELRTAKMLDSLEVGESSLDVHNAFGEPDLRTDSGPDVQVWSYADKPNTNDVTAELLYTAPKEGDKGRFLDLKFVDGKLVSWAMADRTMPAKEGTGMNYGVGSVPYQSSPMHY